MSALTIAGDTSGSITLQAPAVAGSTTINLPSVSGGSFVVSDSSGNVGIGTNAFSLSGANRGLLEINGATDSIIGWKYGDSTVAGYIQGFSGAFNINSGPTIPLYFTAGGTTQPIVFQTNSSERMRIDSSGNLLFNSGYGSAATAYGCRAWVNFNGSGTVAIRGSGNVSSITDNGTGNYRVNFTNDMPDTNYVLNITCSSYNYLGNSPTYLTSSVAFAVGNTSSGVSIDPTFVNVSIFR